MPKDATVVPSSPRLRVALLLEGFELVRRGIRAQLASSEDVAAVSELSSTTCLSQQPAAVPADVVLIGVDPASEVEGAALVRRAVQAFVGRPVIVLAAQVKLEAFKAALLAGASGYVLSSISGAALHAALRAAAGGCFVVDPLVARYLAQELGAADTATRHDLALGALSPREREVWQGVARGMTNQQIASSLHVTTGTVKTHVRHIFRKLGAQSRLQAVLNVEARGPAEELPRAA